MATTLLDGNGFTWDIQDNGTIYNGTRDAFDTGAVLGGFGYASQVTLEDGGREIVLGPITSGNFTVVRKIYISPSNGFARYLEIVTNNGPTSGNFTVNVSSDLGSDGYTTATTSSGDSVFNTADSWITTDDSDPSGGDPFVTHVIQGGGKLKPTSASLSYDDVGFSYDLSLKAGETKIVMHFLAQNDSLADANADAKALSMLGLDALKGMSGAELSQIVNFDLGGKLTLNGTKGSDILVGGDFDDTISGAAGDDHLSGMDGDDKIYGGSGNDFVQGGNGNDRLIGESGSDILFGDAGDDEIYGDAYDGLVTTTATKTIPGTKKSMSISLTLPDAAKGTSLDMSGYVSRTPVTSELFNIAFVIDVSGSTSDTFSGKKTVGDLNGDGVANTILDAQIAGFEALLKAINAKIGNKATVSIIAFDDEAQINYTGIANADSDGNGRSDVIDSLRSLQDGGGTNFEAGLQKSIEFFNGQGNGQNLLYFLSDGYHNSGGGFDDEVATLRNKNGLNVAIKSYGVGSGASKSHLDMVDDAKANNSTTILLDPSELAGELVDPKISRADISSVQILVNGKVAKTIKAKDLVLTPLGFRFDFADTLKGLKPNADDKITARVIANDKNGTVISTTQIVEHLKYAGSADALFGGEGNDQISGGGGGDLLDGGDGNDRLDGGEGNDRLLGGKGTDVLFGGAGNDRLDGGLGADQMLGGLGNDIYFVDDAGDVVTEASKGGTDTVYASVSHRLSANVERLELTGRSFIDGTGNDLANRIVGNTGGNVLKGMDGNDVLDGKGGTDVLDGGKGNDTLTGGGGIDRFVFKTGYGKDTITDFTATGKANDIIDLTGMKTITDFSDLKANHMQQRGADVLIDALNGDTLLLKGVVLSDLDAADFLF